MDKNKVEDNEIHSYQFQSFNDSEQVERLGKVSEFQIEKFKENDIHDENVFSERRKVERLSSEKSGFQIASIVKKHRGIEEDIQTEYEQKLEAEVERRFLMVKEEAYAIGFEEGIKKGQDEIFEQMRSDIDTKLMNLSEMVNDVLTTRDEILTTQKTQIFTMVKNLTKWIILKELDEDDKYLSRLLEKLVVELQTKSNLLIQVSKKQFEMMPEVLDVVEKSLGKLDNVRMEIDYDIDDNGIIVSSENGIINGTLEQQFSTLSKLFESVGVENGSE